MSFGCIDLPYGFIVVILFSVCRCCLVLFKLLSPFAKFLTKVWNTIRSLLYNSWLCCKKYYTVVLSSMRLPRLRFAPTVLMGVLAAVTVYSLLLRSGNVESNPGPGVLFDRIYVIAAIFA